MRTSQPSVRTIVILVLLLVTAVPVHPITVQEIPNPRPAGWSVDLTGLIPPGALREIDQLGDEVKAKTGAEIAVVVVASLNGAASRNFAVRLFNAWGIGDPARKNGVLIFTALDDHKVEVVLGAGINNTQSRQTSDEIMQSEMVPRFRAGDPAAAVLAGAREHARRILDVQVASDAPEATPAAPGVAQPFVPPARAPARAPQAAAPETDSAWLVLIPLVFLICVIGLGLLLYLVLRTGSSTGSGSRLRSWHSDWVDQSSADSAASVSPFLSDFSSTVSSSSSSSSSSSDSGFSGGSSDGGGSSGQW